MGRLKLWITFWFINLNIFLMFAQESFLQNQLKYDRVREAYKLSFKVLQDEFATHSFSFPAHQIFIRAFKAEGLLEIWIKDNESYYLFKTYDICKSSGSLGPKYKSGDKQVPEGYYSINRFNPMSNFWLSLGINYPNKADQIRSPFPNLGGDIFIHGDCKTIGCLPMTDAKMNEIYILCVLAKNAGQEDIPVHIYPYKFSDLKNSIFYSLNNAQISFWKKLEIEYHYFNENKKLAKISVDNKGIYQFDF